MSIKTRLCSLTKFALACLVAILLCLPTMAYADDPWYTVDSENKIVITGTITDFPPRSFNTIEVAIGGVLAFTDDIVCKYNVISAGTIQGGTFTGTVTNHGTINGGIFENTLPESNVINGGTFNGGITVSATINGGTFKGDLRNDLAINGGTFYGVVNNYGTIYSGTFFGIVNNERIINDGYFRSLVNNYSTIRNGNFVNTVANEQLIENGTFGFAVFNNAIIKNGKFTLEVRGTAPLSVTHSVNGTDKSFTYGNDILAELGDAGDGREWFVGDNMVTAGNVPQVYTEYTAKEYSHSTVQGGNGGNNADELIASEILRIEQELSKLDIATVNGDNAQTLNQLDEDIEFLLNYDKLTDGHKTTLDGLKQQVSALIAAINTNQESGDASGDNSTEGLESEQENLTQSTPEEATSQQPDGAQSNGNKYIAICITVILCAIAAVGIFMHRKSRA